MHVKAGTHRVTAAFIQRFEGLINDLIAPIDHTMADTEIGTASGITTLPHLRSLSIIGPHRRDRRVATRRAAAAIFSCRPLIAGRGNAMRLGHRPSARDAGVPAPGGREGSRAADDVLRARPQGRRISKPASRRRSRRSSPARSSCSGSKRRLADARAGRRSYRLSDYELASRLSFFLWGADRTPNC